MHMYKEDVAEEVKKREPHLLAKQMFRSMGSAFIKRRVPRHSSSVRNTSLSGCTAILFTLANCQVITHPATRVIMHRHSIHIESYRNATRLDYADLVSKLESITP